MTAFATPVRDELARWADAGLRVRLWWRDDDASADTPQLQRLVVLAQRFGLPIGLAVIPKRLAPSLPAAIARSDGALVPQVHGHSHLNHASQKRPAEFGPERRPSDAVRDLQESLSLFRTNFPASSAVFVPPFNRIGARLAHALPGLGFAGLSAWPDRPERLAVRFLQMGGFLPALPLRRPAHAFRTDAHISVIDWRERPRACDAERLGRWTAALLKLRRLGYVEAGRPIGLLTHHLDHDEAIWTLTETVLSTFAAHPAVELTPPDACFPAKTATLSRAAAR